MHSIRKIFTVLLMHFILTSVTSATVLGLFSISSAEPLHTDLFADAETTESSLSSRNTIAEAKRLFDQGHQQYQDGQYSEAEESLRDTLDVLSNGGQSSRFRAPRTRTRDTSISLFGLTLFRFWGSSRSFGSANSWTNTPLDGTYARTIRRLSQGLDPEEAFSSAYTERLDQILGIIEGRVDSEPDEDPVEVNDILDIHKIEVDTFRLLQRVLVAQNQPDKLNEALEIAELNRNLELSRIIPALFYALNDEVLQGRLTDNNLPELLTPRSLELRDIQKIAQRENATLVYYSAISEDEIFVWVVQPSGEPHFRQVNINDLGTPLEVIVENTRRSAASYVDRGQEEVALIQALRDLKLRTVVQPDGQDLIQNFTVAEDEQKNKLQQLYQLLIEPIEELLPTNPNSHVIFIPQGSLLLVPFAALQDSSGQYLIEQHTIRISPNLQSLLHAQSLEEFPTDQGMLIVGNPSNQQTSALPGAEEEAQALGLLTNSFPLIGDQAIPNVIGQRIPNAKIVHFATHGILDVRYTQPIDVMLAIHEKGRGSPFVYRISGTPSPAANSRSRVQYSLWPDNDGNGRWHVIRTNGSLPGAIALTDDFLTSQEIINLSLNADLVVLSACNTARGIPGDSTLLGLPLSLGLAGVPRVMVSLWAVPDVSTQMLMLEFYSAMKKQGGHIDEAQALREAMLKVKNDPRFQDPINWAGFTLIDVSQY